MAYEVNDSVLVNGKILKPDGEDGSTTVILDDEAGTIKKIDGNHYYVATAHGTHYLKEDKLTAA